MKSVFLRLGMLALVFSAGGCGDHFHKIVQSELALVNEFADSLVRVVDESSALDFQTNTFPRLKEARDGVRKRKEMYLKSNFDDYQTDFIAVIKAARTSRRDADPKSPLLLEPDAETIEDFENGLEASKRALQSTISGLQAKINDLEPNPAEKGKGKTEADALRRDITKWQGEIKKIDSSKKFLPEYAIEHTRSFRDEFLSAQRRIHYQTDRIAKLAGSSQKQLLLTKDTYKTFNDIALKTAHFGLGGFRTTGPTLRDEGLDEFGRPRPKVIYDMSVFNESKKDLEFVRLEFKWLNTATGEERKRPAKDDQRLIDWNKGGQLDFDKITRDERPRRIRLEGDGWEKSRPCTVFIRFPDPTED